MPLSAKGVDPRDETWEERDPEYRVYFFDAAGASDEWELTGCDVESSVAWANERAEGRTFVVYAVVRRPGEVGLVRLLGRDPNAA